MIAGDLHKLLADLVGIPSVNRMGRSEIAPSSGRMLDYIEAWLHARRIPTTRMPVPGGEQNLVATLPGPAGSPTVLFDAHTDTVPAEGWEERAFVPRREGDRLYGRGSCDTKGCMSAMLVALADAAQAGALPHTVIFTATADEEYMRTGVNAWLDAGGRADLAIVGEPTCLKPVVACKGVARWDVIVPGRNAHSSTPHEGVNAITRVGELVRAIEEYNDSFLKTRSHPLVRPSTLTPTMIAGGSAPNVVPSSCRVHLDLRTLPSDDPRLMLQEAQRFLNQRCSFPLEHVSERVFSGADLAPDHPLVQRCVASIRHVCGPETAATPLGANYGCHASDLAGRGVPSVVLGPGDIGVAHAIDEFIDLPEVEHAAKIYYDLMTRPL